MKSQLPRLVELRGDDLQATGWEDDVGALETDELPRAHAGHREEADGRLDRGGPQGGTQETAGPHQRGHLFVAIDVGRNPSAPLGQEILRRDLAAGVDRVQVGGEAPHHGQALVVAQRGALRLDRPGERRLDRHRLGRDPVEIAGELGERAVLAGQHVAERPAQTQVILDRREQGRSAHRPTSGQGRASAVTADASAAA